MLQILLTTDINITDSNDPLIITLVVFSILPIVYSVIPERIKDRIRLQFKPYPDAFDVIGDSLRVGDRVKLKVFSRHIIYVHDPEPIIGTIERFHYNYRKEISGLVINQRFIGFDEYVIWDIERCNKHKKEHLPAWF